LCSITRPRPHAFLAALVCEAAKDRKKPRVWLVCDIPRHRERLAAEMELWGINALVLPDPPTETGDGTIADPESAAEWFSVLEILARSESCAVLCGSDAFSGKAPSPAALRSSRTPLKPGTALDPDELAQSLANHGYERVPTVTPAASSPCAAASSTSSPGRPPNRCGWSFSIPIWNRSASSISIRRHPPRSCEKRSCCWPNRRPMPRWPTTAA
jgi:hypothetical protein